MTRWDWVLSGIIFSAALILQLTSVSWATAGLNDHISITSPYGKTRIDLSMSADSIVSIQGHKGTIVFEVREGALYCVEASCPDGICLRSGPVAPGRPIVCVPNGVIAYMPGKNGDYDAVSR